MKTWKAGFSTVITDIWLLLLRLFAGAFMLTHGYPKLTRLMEGGEIKFGDPIGLGPGISLGLAVFAEFGCAILVGIGVFTRWATIPLIITMSVAAFVVHAQDPFGNQEKALLYLLIYISILIFGPGKYSIDQAGSGKRRSRYR